MSQPASVHEPEVRPEQFKILKEKTVEELISRRLGLVNSSTADGDSFFFKPHSNPNILNRTIIQFRGPNQQTFKEKATILLRSDRHRVEDQGYKGSIVLYLAAIDPAPYDSVFGLSGKKPEPPVVQNLSGLSPSEMLRADPGLQRGLETVGLFHVRRLLLGVKNKKGEIVFLSDQSSEIAVEYNYIDEAEATEVCALSQEIFGYAPVVRPGNKKSEKVVLRFALESLKDVDQRSLRQMKARVFKDRTLSSVEVAKFVITKMFREKCTVNTQPGLENAVFHLERSNVRQAILQKLDSFCIQYAIDQKDHGCFRIRKEDTIGVVKTVASIPIEHSVLGARSPRRFVADALESFGLKRGDDFGVAPPQYAEDGTTLLYVSAKPKSEKHQKLLREKLSELQATLPSGVEVSFEGLFHSKTKSIYFYFPSRKAAMLLVNKETEEGQGTSSEKNEPASESRNKESLVLRIFRDGANGFTDSERQTLASLLGIKDNSEAAVNAYKQELAKRLEGCMVINENDERAKSIMATYHPDIFKNPAEFLDK